MYTLISILIVVTATVRFADTQNICKDEAAQLELKPAAQRIVNEKQMTFKNSPENTKMINNTRKKRFSYLHAIEEDLLHQNWKEQEQPCLRQLLRVIENVQNSTLWASLIWDSMQFPVGQLYGSRSHLGNYDQCINMPWKEYPDFRTQYCLAEIHLSELDPEITSVDLLGPVQKYIRLKTRHGLRYNDLLWGICVPVVCKSESIEKFADAMFRYTHLGQMNMQYNVSVDPEYCQIAGEFKETGFIDYLFLLLVVSFIMITFLCTWYLPNKGAESKFTPDFAKAFYIKSNAKWLTRADDTSIRSVMGIRVISSFLVAVGHKWLTKNVVGVINAGEIDKNLDDSFHSAIFNIDMVVDTFFVMSGLILTKSIIKQKLETFNPLAVIIRRYIRLTCSLLLILLVFPIVLTYGNTGPLVKKHLQFEEDACAKNWWKSLLMIGNYADSENISYAVLWSLACDFHLFVIGVLICWIYLKSKSAGTKAYIVCTTASWVIPVLYGFMYKGAAVITYDFRISDNYRKYLIGDPAYVRTHLRAGPYFVGMAIGYLMAMFHPEKYRNALSKKTSILGFFLFLGTLASLHSLSGIYHGREYSALEGALFSVMRRNVFATLLGFLIVICEYGSLPLVSSALSCPGLVPLSKLSYGVYLTHLMFTFRFVSRTRVPLHSDIMDDIFSTFGMMAITLTLSLFMWLFWEAPIMNLFDMIFKRYAGKTKRSEQEDINERRSGKTNIASTEYDKDIYNEKEKKTD